jgi:hypothetical protein
MAQADFNNSTTAPVDTTRRRFLAVAAVGSVVGVGSDKAAMLVPNVPQAVTVPHVSPALHDPVFGLIEAHRKAEATHLAAIKELDQLDKTPGFKDWGITEQPCHDEFNAFDALLAAAATTLPGILAKLAYLQDIAEREAWMFNDRKGSAIRLIESFAVSISTVSVTS